LSGFKHDTFHIRPCNAELLALPQRYVRYILFDVLLHLLV